MCVDCKVDQINHWNNVLLNNGVAFYRHFIGGLGMNVWNSPESGAQIQ